MKIKEFTYFYIGILGLAFVIGILTGISSSPVVGVIIPLIFSLLTAGGSTYVLVKKMKSPEGLQDIHKEVRTIGIQLLNFSAGFLAGIWIGVFAKFNSENIWLTANNFKPAYSILHFYDPRYLNAAMNLDRSMISSNLEYQERLRIFNEIDEARKIRSKNQFAKISVLNNILNIYEKPDIIKTYYVIKSLDSILAEMEALQKTEYDDSKIEILSEKLRSVKGKSSYDFVEQVNSQLEVLKSEVQNIDFNSALLEQVELEAFTFSTDGKKYSSPIFRPEAVAQIEPKNITPWQ